MRSIIVDGRFYRSVRAYAEASGEEYHQIMAEHVKSSGGVYFFRGHKIRRATEEEAQTSSNGELVREFISAGSIREDRKGGPLIPFPVTSGIGTTWGFI